MCVEKFPYVHAARAQMTKIGRPQIETIEKHSYLRVNYRQTRFNAKLFFTSSPPATLFGSRDAGYTNMYS